MSLRPKGFTLIEILLVIVLLMIVTAMAIPSFTQSFAQLQLRDATNDIAYLMRYAQSRAIYTHRPLQLRFDELFTHYWLEQAVSPDNEELEEEIPANYQPVSGRLGRVSRVPEGLTLNTANPSITFAPDGRIDKTQIHVCRTNQCLIISTQNQSGAVVVAEGISQ